MERHLLPLLTLYRYRHHKIKQTGLRLLPDLMMDFVGHLLLRYDKSSRQGTAADIPAD